MSVCTLPLRRPPIVRSPGIRVDGQIIGGGMTGATPELDALVAAAAEVLRDKYGRGVMIRYNMDRRAGGAWLITHAVDGIDHNAEIGICADYVIRDQAAMQTAVAVLDDPDMPIEEMDRRVAAIPRVLSLFAHIGSKSLRDPASATVWYSSSGNIPCDNAPLYTHRLCVDIADAIGYLSDNAILRECY